MDSEKLKPILEALFAASDKPLSVNQLFDLFTGDLEQPGKDDIRKAIQELTARYEGSGFELKQVASGFRFQVRVDFETWVARMWEQKPPRYSRALMETLALIAYRQPITRGEIEDIRGVSVGTNIIKTLQERDWIKSLGHKEVPGRPTLYGTTKTFLDYFNLKSLNELPTLAEIRNLDHYNPEFEFDADAGRAALARSESAPGGDGAGSAADETAESRADAPAAAVEEAGSEAAAAAVETADSETATAKQADDETATAPKKKAANASKATKSKKAATKSKKKSASGKKAAAS